MLKFEKPKRIPEEEREQCSEQREQHVQKAGVERKLLALRVYS